VIVDVNDLTSLLATETFKCILDTEPLKFGQYMAIITLLTKKRIPFDTTYTPGNRRKEPELTLTVYITPRTTMVISFSELSLTDSK